LETSRTYRGGGGKNPGGVNFFQQLLKEREVVQRKMVNSGWGRVLLGPISIGDRKKRKGKILEQLTTRCEGEVLQRDCNWRTKNGKPNTRSRLLQPTVYQYLKHNRVQSKEGQTPQGKKDEYGGDIAETFRGGNGGNS